MFRYNFLYLNTVCIINIRLRVLLRLQEIQHCSLFCWIEHLFTRDCTIDSTNFQLYFEYFFSRFLSTIIIYIYDLVFLNTTVDSLHENSACSYKSQMPRTKYGSPYLLITKLPPRITRPLATCTPYHLISCDHLISCSIMSLAPAARGRTRCALLNKVHSVKTVSNERVCIQSIT